MSDNRPNPFILPITGSENCTLTYKHWTWSILGKLDLKQLYLDLTRLTSFNPHFEAINYIGLQKDFYLIPLISPSFYTQMDTFIQYPNNIYISLPIYTYPYQQYSRDVATSKMQWDKCPHLALMQWDIFCSNGTLLLRSQYNAV